MEMSYRQLEVILAAFLSVHPERLGTFRSRLKQLQRLEFPDGVNIGRGTRMTYGATHLLQLAVAFELIGTGMPAKTATETVNAYWPRFKAAFGRAYRWMDNGEGNETFVCFGGRPIVDGDKFPAESVTIQNRDSLLNRTMVEGANTPGRAGLIVIRADYMFRRVNQLAQDVGQVGSPLWNTPEYGVWANERERNPQWWDDAGGMPAGLF